MSEAQALLRHFVAALAYRTQKALRDAPADFASFRAAPGVRTPQELVRHMSGVLDHTLGRLSEPRPPLDTLPSLEAEVRRFHELCGELVSRLEGEAEHPHTTPGRLLQGPLADAMTHVGQIAILRRLAGSPIPPENFHEAAIDPANVGPLQPPPVSPSRVWPEAPAGWRPPGS